MLTLRLLGGIGLTDSDGHEIDALLRQPKHVALLAYLCMPHPGTWHRRDSLLAMFWPEADETRARASLRTALYTLRGHLRNDAIKSRGDDDLCAAPDLISTDASAMTQDFEAGRFAEALARYRGELLPGLYIEDAPTFEKWLETERARVSRIARKSASHVSHDLEARGDINGAIDSARQACELEPADEAAARRWIALLDKAGDRSQAFAVYERFRNHMSEQFGVRPSAETVSLLDAIRTRRSVPERPVLSTPDAQAPSPERAPRTSRERWLLPVAGISVVLIAAALLITQTGKSSAKSPAAPPTLVILPMENKTGDASLDYIATGIAEGVAHRLDGLGGLKIRSAARSEWTDAVKRDVGLIGQRLGSAMLLRSVLTKSRDSLEVTTSLVDTLGKNQRNLSTFVFLTDGIRDVESRIVAEVAGSVFRKGLPQGSRDLDRPVDPESYKLMLHGWQSMFARPGTGIGTPREVAARDDFQKAVALDPLNARAWSGLSTVWASLTATGSVPFEEGFNRASAAALHALAIDSMQGSAWANLAAMRALKYSDLSIGLELLKKAERAEPSNPEIFLIKASMFRAAHRYDDARDAIRVATSLDPLSLVYRNHEAMIEFCEDKPEAALKIFELERAMSPGDPFPVRGVIRSLALLDRFDEALALWRSQAAARGDTALANHLAKAHGANGYWALKHQEGQKELARLSKDGDATPLSTALANFSAGNPEAAYDAIETAPSSVRATFYRLACTPAADEYRRTARFKEVIAKIGSLDLH